MALAKQVDLPDGTVVNYWRIVRWTCDVRGRQITVIVEPYLSDAVRLANKEPVEAGVVVVRLPFTAALADNGRPALYAALKQHPAFAGATDA